MTEAYPLSWPLGWKRTPAHMQQRAKFSTKETVYGEHGSGSWQRSRELTIYAAMRRLADEIGRLGGSGLIVSTNCELRRDGQPRSDRKQPADPGAAVYFKLSGKDRVLACDKWDTVAGNIAAIAAHVDAIRRQERYGVGTMEQAFAGYAALPPPSTENKRPWWRVLGYDIPDQLTVDECEARYRSLARERHPDNGGSHEQMSELNSAVAEARQAAKVTA